MVVLRGNAGAPPLGRRKILERKVQNMQYFVLFLIEKTWSFRDENSIEKIEFSSFEDFSENHSLQPFSYFSFLRRGNVPYLRTGAAYTVIMEIIRMKLSYENSISVSLDLSMIFSHLGELVQNI